MLTKERVVKMDRKDGKAWEVEVWNAAEDPGGDNDVANAKPFPRLYEHKSRALLRVPFLGKLKDGDLQGLEPHKRIYLTGFSQPKGEFKGTHLSCVGILYCDGADKTKPYNEWRGRLHHNEETNTKRFISEICAGYFVKLNTNCKPIKENTSYAVLYAFRPWSDRFGEPQLAVKEMKDGNMIKDVALKIIKADQLVAIGGLTNSLCDGVVAWLQANLPCFKSMPLAKGATADVARALEGSLGVLNAKSLRERYVTNMRVYMDELMTDERRILGTRKGDVQWTKREEGKDAEVMTTRVHKEATKYDK